MATPKQAGILSSYFAKKYKEKYGDTYKLNRYAARWGFDAILMDYDEDGAKALIDYYFETASPNGHNLVWFFNNYDRLAESKEKADEDRAELARLREQSRLRTEEWRKRKNGDE
jgi:hypothetical protein